MVNVNSALQSSLSQLLGVNTRQLSNSFSALASGNRLTQASTDIAALSVATGLQSEVSTLRSAANNIAQASSFLQVADGGLQQTGAILDRLAALATQANSGALSDSARKGLNTEFQGLVQELDRIAGNTNFNNVNLLDGSLSNNSRITTETATGEQARGSLTFGGNINAGESVTLNGITLTEGVDFNAGGTVQETIDNLANTLNSDSRFDGFSFERFGTALNIEADAAGEAGNQFTIDTTVAGSAAFTVNGDALTGGGVFSLQGGTDAGLSAGDVQANGSINDNLLTSGTGQEASTTLSFTNASDIQAGDTIDIDDGEGGVTTFTYVNGAPTNANEIQIGSTLEETLENTAETLNDFSGPGDYGVRQLTATVDGNSLTLSGNVNGNLNDVNGNPLDVALNTTGGNISNTQLNNGSTGGVDVSNVTNAGFAGEIQGFQATYNGVNDQATVSVNVGGETYTAQLTDTTPGADTTVTFTSENGGSFDVTLSGGNGQSVNSQADANALADRFDAAFSGLDFSQTRDVTSFNGTGQLVGSSLEITGSNFDGLDAESVDVTSNGNGNSSIEVTINGEVYRADNLGDSIGAGEEITLTSTTNPNNSLTFTNGNNQLDISNDTGAGNVQAALEDALGIPGNQGAAFQIGSSTSDTTNLSIGDVSSDALFNGLDLNILTADGAAQALGAIRGAIGYVTSQRADVGSFQSALDFAAANVESAIQNQEAARAALADTDFAAESTNNALLQVQRQAQLATLAQSNRLQGNLLQLLVE